jgi:hypothetical protein
VASINIMCIIDGRHGRRAARRTTRTTKKEYSKSNTSRAKAEGAPLGGLDMLVAFE